ncbi:MAG: IMP dehydrogenase [Patescibacteria group bacterium]
MSDKFRGLGLTFDDVLVLPGLAEVEPKGIDVSTYLTRRSKPHGVIRLGIPIIAAPMDTVTESGLAIAMAREGGLGIIHRGCPVDYEVEKVKLVKRAQSGKIHKPYTLHPDQHLSDVRKLMDRRKISGIPIVDENKTLVGLVTRRDVLLRTGDDDPLIREIMKPRNQLIVGDDSTDLDAASRIMNDNRIKKLPLVDAEGKSVGMYTRTDILTRIQYPRAVFDDKGRLLVGAAVGVTDFEDRIPQLVHAGADVLCVDVSHAHSVKVLHVIKWIRSWIDANRPSVALIGGNVGTYHGARAVIDAGVDVIKVGIGPGSICTTRVITGGGVPQITAVQWAVDAARDAAHEATTDQNHPVEPVPVIADGGIRHSGDVVKCLVAGASSAMLGSMLAGTEESPGEFIIHNGRKTKVYRGMGSQGAIAMAADRYGHDDSDIAKAVPEGIEGMVDYRGFLKDVIFQIVGGIRAGLGLAGQPSVADAPKAQFIQITNAGIVESHPHDVLITQQAPNYYGR